MDDQKGKLPEGWFEAHLGDVAELVSGAGFPLEYQGKQGLEYPFFKVGNLGEIDSGEELVSTKDTIDGITANLLRAKIIPPGAVLFAKIGMAIRLNRRRQASVSCCIDNNMMAAIPGAAIEPRLLLRYLETLDFMPLTQATTVPSLRKADLEWLPLPLPPLVEQHRIGAKVEALLARVNAARQRLAKAPAILKRFRQSVLAAACDGRLTADWREQNHEASDAVEIVAMLEAAHAAAGGHRMGNAASPTEEAHDLTQDSLPQNWCLTDLRTAVQPDRPITYGILKPGPDTAGGVLYVRVADFPNDRLKLATIKRTSKEIEKAYARARLREGDILLSIRGTVGRVCTVPHELQDANITQDTARLSIQSALYQPYLVWYLRAHSTQNRMQKAIKGVAVRGINIGDVRALQLPVPPLAEQHEIVRRVEALFKLADAIEKRVALAMVRTEKLTQAILAKAFRGALVSTEAELARRERRDYEPASALLERIRAERAANNGKPIAKRKTRKEQR